MKRWPATETPCVCLEVQRAGRAIGRLYDQALRGVGLSHGQYSLLAALERSPAPSMRRLAAHLGMDRTTTTGNLKPLARRGLVELRADREDARIRRVILTEAGSTLLAEARERWRAVNADVISSIPGHERAALRSGLRVITALGD